MRGVLCPLVVMLAVARCAASDVVADWPTPRHDTHLTARQPRHGAIRSAPTILTRTPVAPGAARLRPFATIPDGQPDRALALTHGALRCYDLAGRLRWKSHPPGLNFDSITAIEDLDGDGRVEIALMAGRPTSPLGAALLLDAATGRIRWRYDVEPMSYSWYFFADSYLPAELALSRLKGGAPAGTRTCGSSPRGKQLIVLEHAYPPDPRNGYIVMFEFPAPGKPPAQRWRYDFDHYTCFPSLLRADLDGDGVQEICVETHSRMWVLDALTGAVKQFIEWDVSPANVRSYGLVRFQDLNRDGRPDFLCIANFAQHHEVLLNDRGKLKLAWAHGWDNSVTTSKIATAYPPQPVADVDGDGRLEIVLSMFNSEAEPRWMIRIYDAVTGELKARVADHIAVALADVDGDSGAEILADASRDPTRVEVMGAALFKIVGGQPQLLWREDGVKAVESLPRGWRKRHAAPPAGGAPPAGALLVTRGDQMQVLTFSDGRAALEPYTAAPAPARPDTSRVKAPDGEITPPPLINDLDGGGKPEIIHTWQGKTTIYHWDRKRGFAAIRELTSSGDPALADLDGDGKTEIIVADAGPDRLPTIRALRPDGTALWESRLPPPNRAGLPHGRAVYLQVGRFTGKATPDVYALIGTPIVRSVVLDGATGKLAWEKSEFPDIERYYGPTVNLAAVHDVDGDGADDLVFTNPDYYCVASGRSGDMIVGPIIPQKIFNQPSQGLYSLPAILADTEPAPAAASSAQAALAKSARSHPAVAAQASRLLVVLCDGHYFLGAIGLRAEPRWYQLPEVGAARSAAEGFARLPDGEWIIGFGRQNGNFACLDAATGRLRWELPIDASAGDVVACDINGDGVDEFIFGDSHGCLRAVADRGGKPIVVWKVALRAAGGSPVIADLDGDGALEIIVPTADGNLTVLGPGNR
jgi:hypothetical protein